MGMNITEAVKFLPIIFKTNLRPCFLGHTGIGKTEVAKQYAAKHGLTLIIIHVAQLEPSDFVGLYKIDEDGRTSNCPPAWLPKEVIDQNKKGKKSKTKTPVVKVLDKDKGESLKDVLPNESDSDYNEKGYIIFLDEFNRAHEDMRQALYQFIQDKRIHTYQLPDNAEIICAANPPSEGYEAYEFDPAMINRLAWVNFMPDFEETRDYLRDKHGRSVVLSWVESNKGLIDMGSDFEIKGLLYSPRMTENHILLYEAVRKENKEFKRKVFETIMQKEKASAFMAYLEEVEFMNYVDVMNGLNPEKEAKLQQLLQDNRMDILSTIAMDLADFFSRWEKGMKHKDIKDEKATIVNVTNFLEKIEDETFMAFCDGLEKAYENPKSITYDKYFREKLKPKAKKYKHIFT